MTPSASSNSAAFAQEAANLCESAINRHHEDAHLGLEYLLKRMTAAGLPMAEVPQLKQLGVAVFKKSGIDAAADAILQNSSASPLAVAMAGVVKAAPANEQEAVLLGSVLGAHAAVEVGRGDHAALVFAAVNGAAVARTTKLTQPFIAHGQGAEWAARD
jgi:hypothetical protein